MPFNLDSCLAYGTWVLNLSCALYLGPYRRLPAIAIQHVSNSTKDTSFLFTPTGSI